MSSANFAEMELELGDLLQEFDTVVEELTVPSHGAPYAYERLLIAAKRRTGLGDGVSDSGIEDSDYGSEPSLGNSLNASEEELRTAGTAETPKAKLGETEDLQSFIESLDRELAEM